MPPKFIIPNAGCSTEGFWLPSRSPIPNPCSIDCLPSPVHKFWVRSATKGLAAMRQCWGWLCKELAGYGSKGCYPIGSSSKHSSNPAWPSSCWLISQHVLWHLSLAVCQASLPCQFPQIAGFPPAFHHLSRIEEPEHHYHGLKLGGCHCAQVQQLLDKAAECPDSPLLCKWQRESYHGVSKIFAGSM